MIEDKKNVKKEIFNRVELNVQKMTLVWSVLHCMYTSQGKTKSEKSDLEHRNEAMDYNEIILSKYGTLIIINISSKNR